MNLQKIIQIGIHYNKSLNFLRNINTINYIVAEIACYSRNKCFQFDKNVLGSGELSQLTFNSKLNEVYFNNPNRDFINIINDNNFNCRL